MSRILSWLYLEYVIQILGRRYACVGLVDWVRGRKIARAGNSRERGSGAGALAVQDGAISR